jgi:hypothetical protein
MQTEQDQTDNFILLPAISGGGALVRRSQISGARANGAGGNEGSIVYLASGPSVHSTASIPQLGRYLNAEVADLRQ